LQESIIALVNLLLAGNYPPQLAEYIARAPLTPLVKPGGCIRPIVVGTIWRRLGSKVAASTVSKDMPNPKSKDEGKSLVIEKSKEATSSKEEQSTSLAKAEKIISGKQESSTNKVLAGTKVFSSFQVGKQNPKEEEYLAFTRYIYNLPEESGETYGVLGTISLFPRISIFPNGSPGFTSQLFEFGYLDRVYANPDLKDISQLPSQLVKSVKRYAEGEGVYCRFFSIAMESKDLQLHFPTINYITVEKLRNLNVKAT